MDKIEKRQGGFFVEEARNDHLEKEINGLRKEKESLQDIAKRHENRGRKVEKEETCQTDPGQPFKHNAYSAIFLAVVPIMGELMYLLSAGFLPLVAHTFSDLFSP